MTIILLAMGTNAIPGEEWNKTFGRADMDSASSVQQTLDGGYILAGQSMHWAGDSDAWLIKTDAQGNEQWNRTYGKTIYERLNMTLFEGNDWASSIQNISDGDYLFAGGTFSYRAGLSDAGL